MGPSFDIIHGPDITNMSSISNLRYEAFIPTLRTFYQHPHPVYFRINPFTGSPEHVTPWINLDPGTMYLTGIMEENIGTYAFPNHVQHYNEDNISLNIEAFNSACGLLRDHFTEGAVITNAAVKHLAFCTSEAARFESVYEANRHLLETGALPGVTGSWSNWSPLVHAWSAISAELPFASAATGPGLPIGTGICTVFLDHHCPAGSQFTNELAALMIANDSMEMGTES